MAHMLEAMEILNRIKKSGELMELVNSLDFRTRASFVKTCEFIGSDDMKKMQRIRNKLTFHYDNRIVNNILSNPSPGIKDKNLEVTLSHDLSQCYFAPSDLVLDQFVVRDVFEVPYGADVRKEVDEIVDRLQVHLEVFGDFAMNFIHRCTATV